MKDLTGQKFGKLLVVERLPKYKGQKTYYRCICDCGNERIVSNDELTNGNAVECLECSKITHQYSQVINRVGEKYNNLTIMEMLPNYKGNGKTFVRCKCDCGNERISYVYEVVSGKVKCCSECAE